MTERLLHKTIFDFKHKTPDQIKSMLTLEAEMFYADNPGFKYVDYKYTDGFKGERSFILIFRSNAD